MAWALGLDMLLIVMGFFSIKSGYTRGFLVSVLELIVFLLSVALGIWLSPFFGGILYEVIGKNLMTRGIGSILASAANMGAEQQVVKLISLLPPFIGNSIDGYGISVTSLVDTLSKGGAQESVPVIVNILGPIIRDICKVIASYILIFIFNIVFMGIVKKSSETIKVGFAKNVDAILGAIFCFCKYAITAFVVIMMIKSMMSSLMNKPEIFSRETIDRTKIFKTVYDVDYNVWTKRS